MSERPWLRALAERVGIALTSVPRPGEPARPVEDATLEALLAGCGHECDSETAAERALQDLARRDRARWLDPLRVVVEGSPEAAFTPLAGEAPARWEPGAAWQATLTTEHGESRTLRVDSNEQGGVGISLPSELPLGYHRLELHAAPGALDGTGATDPPSLSQSLVVAPERAYSIEEALGDEPAFGVTANLYSIRSDRGLGHGDMGDLRRLVELTGRHGGCFVGLNPIHASARTPVGASPYSPIDRLHRDPLYLEIESIPECSSESAATQWLDSAEAQTLREADCLDRGRIWPLKAEILERLFGRFRSEALVGGTERGRAFERDVAEAGQALLDHATFVAIAEWQIEVGARGVDPWDWRTWPRAYRSPRSEAVSRLASERRDSILFHQWLQWELARQLEGVDRAGRERGLALGLLADCALGSAPGGVETWRAPHRFARGVEAGAPPDAFAADGQSWGFPPLVPDRLVDGHGHRDWIELLRSVFRHSGAFRLDHAMSLQRLFWVPEGHSARGGSYVRYPFDSLLGLLALESRRHEVVLVAEDLGTVAPGFSEQIRARGLLSTRLLPFERDAQGFRRAASYPSRALVATGTHDLAPMAGWWSGADLALRAGEAGADEGALDALQRGRSSDREALQAVFREEGVLLPDVEPTPEQAVLASTRFLARTPCALVGLQLDDLGGEEVPVNVPGVMHARPPNWCRRMSRRLREIESSELARGCLTAMEARRRPAPPAETDSGRRRPSPPAPEGPSRSDFSRRPD